MKPLNGPTAAVVIAFLAAITIVNLFAPAGKDSTIITVGLAILGGLGLLGAKQAATDEKASAVKEQTNGTTSRMLDIIERQMQQLYVATPPVIDSTATVVEPPPQTPPQP